MIEAAMGEDVPHVGGRSTGVRLDPSILRENDIRGVVGKTLFAADARAIGRSFAQTLDAVGGRRVAVAYDGRLTSPELESALVDGLAEGGIDVVRIGRGPTSMLYFAAATLAVDGGVMVTASHNPADYNGFKFILRGKPFFAEEIERLALAASTIAPAGEPRGRIENRAAIADAYLARLRQEAAAAPALSVAWDPGNGATGEILTKLIAGLPGRHYLINAAIDGSFPAHHPDPAVPGNLAQLRALVAAKGCDLGFAFDGDGDRIGVVDSRGRIIWPDQLMAILARDVLRCCPGAPIIADVKSSQVLFDEIARLGGRPIMLPAGHSLIKSRLLEWNSPLAGEMSGHIFFADRYFGADDAVYAALRLLGVLGQRSTGLAELVEQLPVTFATPEIRVACSDLRKFAIVEIIRERLCHRGADVIAIDGVRVRDEDGWWLVRASRTQPAVVLRVEAKSAEGLQRLKRQLVAALTAAGAPLRAAL